uniref:HAT C-terminal dimerisation domain-containing protein n=1 Tax=Esox lucius TaxID=8010 RepID=A0AAY5L6I1_ESOLU
MASVSRVSILDYFNIVFEGENGKIESNCKACGTRIQAKRSVTSNFVTHLKVLISEAIAKMLVQDLQPASMVALRGFTELLQLLEPRYTPEPPRYLHTQLLPAYAYQAQLATRQALTSAPALSLSISLCRGFPGAPTGSNAGYLGVTCHFLSSDWQMRSALLACLPLVGGLSASRVLAEFEEVCVAHAVSGRAFRVVADPFPTETHPACRLPGFRIHGNPGEDAEEDDEEESGTEEGEGGGVVERGDWWEGGLGSRRMDCFCRSLAQCVRDGLLSSSPLLSSTLAKASSFYNYVTSAVPHDKLVGVLGRAEGGLRAAGETDWAAQLKVLRGLLDSAEFLEDLSDRADLALTGQEVALLRELADTLEPFTEAWDMVHTHKQGDCHVSISLALPCVLGLRKHLSECVCPQLPCLLLGLSQAVERRLAPILEDPLYVTATTLDPQFKLTWSSDPDWHRQVLLDEVTKHTQTYGPSTELAPQAQSPDTALAPSPVPSSTSLSRPCKLFSFIKQRPTTQVKSVEQELSGYLREEPTDEEPLHYWRRKAIDFPQLCQVAKRAFTVPAGTSAVETIFTSSGRWLRPDRGRALPKNLETLIYLKANYRLLWS